MKPVIITCLFNKEAAEYFNSFRQQYFPKEKNYLQAHLTLFHHILLPADDVIKDVKQTTLNTKPFVVNIERIAFTGRGAAFVVKSDALIRLHKSLQQQFKNELTPQDKQGLWPHITIQNKASADESKSLADALQKTFNPFDVTVSGLQLFYYENGPWQHITDLLF